LPATNKRIDHDSSLKHQLKIARWQLRRFNTSLRWGPDKLASVPAVLGNAMPKSGSHLIIQVLQGLTRIGPFVNPGFPPVNRAEDNRQYSVKGILDNINSMRTGDIGYGYLDARDEYVSALNREGLASIFVFRDPRDMIVSHVFYATEIFEEHGMHEYYTKKLSTMEVIWDGWISQEFYVCALSSFEEIKSKHSIQFWITSKAGAFNRKLTGKKPGQLLEKQCNQRNPELFAQGRWAIGDSISLNKMSTFSRNLLEIYW